MAYPLPTLGPTISAAGISIPSFDDVLQSLIAIMQAIYGADIYLQPDSQDGQMIAAFATAINDSNMSAVATFNSFAPTFAQGAGLSSLVKLNGLRRLVPTNSTVTVTLVGVVGTEILNGTVGDGTNAWDLPASVIIPGGGSIDVIATAEEAGALTADANTITKILTPQLGWQSVNNVAAATPGNPVETDAELRLRQSVSTTLPAQSLLSSMSAAIANIVGVTQVASYENVTDAADANGAPEHSVYFVVLGGDDQQIIDAIGAKKTLGANTYGTTVGTYTDPVTGQPYAIKFFRPTPVVVAINITLHALTGAGVDSAVQAQVTTALQSYLNNLGIEQDVQLTRLYAPAYLNGAANGGLYEVTVLQINKDGGAFGTADVVIAYNEIASAGAVTITVT